MASAPVAGLGLLAGLAFGDQRRFERVDPVGENVGCDRHEPDSTTIAGDCDQLTQWVSQLVAPLPGRVRTPAVQWVAPVNAFEHVTQLSRGDRDYAISRRRPDKPAAFQSLSVERHAETVVPEDFDQIATSAAKHKQITSVGIAL
jgi:hypothetical protein